MTAKSFSEGSIDIGSFFTDRKKLLRKFDVDTWVPDPICDSCATLKVWMTIVESGWNVWVWLVGVVIRRWVWLVGVGEIYGCG